MSALRIKYTKIRFRLGLRPDPAGGAYSARQTPSWWGGGSLRCCPKSHPALALWASVLGPSGFDTLFPDYDDFPAPGSRGARIHVFMLAPEYEVDRTTQH